MKVNSVIDVHVSICKKLVNHLSLKVLLICSLHQTYTMNETNNVTRAITCFFLSLAWEVASLAFRDTSVGFSSEERAHKFHSGDTSLPTSNLQASSLGHSDGGAGKGRRACNYISGI